MLLSQSLQQVEEPKAATTSRSVLAGIMGNPVSMRRYKVGAKGSGARRCISCLCSTPAANCTVCSLRWNKHVSMTSATWRQAATRRAARCVQPSFCLLAVCSSVWQCPSSSLLEQLSPSCCLFAPSVYCAMLGSLTVRCNAPAGRQGTCQCGQHVPRDGDRACEHRGGPTYRL